VSPGVLIALFLLLTHRWCWAVLRELLGTLNAAAIPPDAGASSRPVDRTRGFAHARGSAQHAFGRPRADGRRTGLPVFPRARRWEGGFGRRNL